MTTSSLVLIPLEGLLHKAGLPLQSFPLFIFFAIMAVFKWCLHIKRSNILRILFIIYIYLLLVSAINLIGHTDQIRFFIRQIISLNIGIVIFLFLRYIFENSSDKLIARYIMYGFFIVVLFAFIDIIQQKYRVESIFSEPSHLGQYLMFIVFPSLVLFKQYINKIIYYISFCFMWILLLLTFSSTAIIKLILIIMGIMFFSSKISFFNKIIILSILFVSLVSLYYYIFEVNSDNYMAMMISASINAINEKATVPLSIIDRGSFWIALYNINFNLGTIFGYGIGGDAIHYSEIFPENVVSQMVTVKQFGFSVNSLFGKLLIYGGVIGLVLYFFIIRESYKIIKLVPQYDFLKAVLFAIYLYMSIGMGVFTMIEIWFWLAFLDARKWIYRRGVKC